MDKVPIFIKKYLWDVPIGNISLKEDAVFVIERILEYGNEEALDWLNENYKKEQIVSVLKRSKKISPKSGNLYALYYGVDKQSLKCIQNPYTQKQNRF